MAILRLSDNYSASNPGSMFSQPPTGSVIITGVETGRTGGGGAKANSISISQFVLSFFFNHKSFLAIF